MTLLLNHQSILCVFFVRFLFQISSTITIWWNFRRYAPVYPSPNLTIQFYVLLVSIFKGNLVRRTSGMTQTSFGNGFIAKSSAIFEHTCAYAWWALRHHFLSVCPSVCLSVCDWTKMQTGPKFKTGPKFIYWQDWTKIHLLAICWHASNSMRTIANCNSWVK